MWIERGLSGLRWGREKYCGRDQIDPVPKDTLDNREKEDGEEYKSSKKKLQFNTWENSLASKSSEYVNLLATLESLDKGLHLRDNGQNSEECDYEREFERQQATKKKATFPYAQMPKGEEECHGRGN